MALRKIRGVSGALNNLFQHSATGPTGRRGYAELLDHVALINKGIKAGPGGRSSVSGITATVFGCTGFLGRYVVNALARQGSQVVIPYRCDDIDMPHLRQMGDLGQMVQFKDFNVRDDAQIRHVIHRSNVIINLIGSDVETMNYSFEEVHVDIARRIAKAAKENPLTERFLHVSCLGASESATSRRLKTKAAGEKAVLEELPEATIFKTGPLVGVEDRLLNRIANMAKTLPAFPLIDGGTTRMQPVYVRDVTNAMMNSLKSRDVLGKTYCLGGPKVFTMEELVHLVYDTIREKPATFPLPAAFAKAMLAPREAIRRSLPGKGNGMLSADFIDELATDAVVPEGVLTFADLNVVPVPIDVGTPIEQLRHMRVGGYDVGTTSGKETSGGAGFGTSQDEVRYRTRETAA